MGMIELHQKRAAVIGLGQSGLAMARWLARAGCTVHVFDDRPQPPGLDRLQALVPEAVFESRPLDASLLGDVVETAGADAAAEAVGADDAPAAGGVSQTAASGSTGAQAGTASQDGAHPSDAPSAAAEIPVPKPVVHLPYGQIMPDEDEDDDTASTGASGTQGASAASAASGTAGDASRAENDAVPDLSDQPFDLLAWSPGVSTEMGGGQQLFEAARKRRIPVVGELDLFMDAVQALNAQGAQAQVIAITGTNGKTTVTRLCAFLANEAGVDAVACGNISPAMLDALMDRLGDADVAAVLAASKASVDAGADTADTADTAETPDDEAAGVPAEAQPEDDASVDAAALVEPGLPPGFILLPPAPPKPEPTAAAAAMPRLWVLELSSFQLAVSQPPAVQAATVLNVTPDHYDWHGSMPNYRAAKMRIHEAAAQRIINLDDPLADPDVPTPWELAAAEAAAAAAAAQPVKGRRRAKPKVVEPVRAPRIDFSLHVPHTAPAFGLVREGGLAWLTEAVAEEDPAAGRRRRQAAPVEFMLNRMMPADALRVQGAHNHANVLAALALLRACGVPMRAMLHALRAFVPDHHRCELVAVVRDIEYIDDSKGTNIGATIAALQGLGRRAVLIAGGVGKDQDFSLLAPAVSAHARAVVLIGRDAPVLRAALADTGVPLHDATTMDDAVQTAATLAQAGDVVLLSPACASFDMFTGYAQRGDVFAQAVRAMAEEAGQAC